MRDYQSKGVRPWELSSVVISHVIDSLIVCSRNSFKEAELQGG